MNEPGPESAEELDLVIADLRRRLIEVQPGSDEAAALVLDLVDTLAERVGQRAGDPDPGIRLDIDEVVDRLEALLDRLHPRSPY
jgi:hypothetical protein